MSLSITWHGHGTISFGVDGQTVLVDPFFDGNPAALIASDGVKAEYILITHGHDDHVGNSSRETCNF